MSVFGSDKPEPGDDPTDRQADAAKNERLLLMGRVGRGEITIEEAKELYGEDLSGLVEPSPAPEVQPEVQAAGGDQDRS